MTPEESSEECDTLETLSLRALRYDDDAMIQRSLN